MILKALPVLKFDIIIYSKGIFLKKKKKTVMGKMISYDLNVMSCCIFTES